MAPEELLARLAVTLRREIGPAVAEPFPKTQTFMASVILEKLSAQLRLAEAHARAEQSDLAALVADLSVALSPDGPHGTDGPETPAPPAAVQEAVARLRDGGGAHALSQLVAALYQERASLGADRFDALLGRVRQTLRARIDRQLEYAA